MTVSKPRPAARVAAVAAPPIPAAKAWLASYDGWMGPPIDLSQAVPGRAPSDLLASRFAAAAKDAESAAYGSILGDDALRRAYAADVGRAYGATVGVEDVAISAGCNQAFFAVALAIANAGESILVPTPWYFNQPMSLDMLGIETQALPTRAEGGFVPSAAVAEGLIDETTRAILLVSPNNPTGAVYPPGVIADFFDLCRRRGLYLVLDETYRDFSPEGDLHGLFARDGWRDHLISLYSFSKSLAVPGYRLGAVAAGPQILSALATVLDCIQICPPRAPQIAMAETLGELAGWRGDAVAQTHAKSERFRTVMAARPQWAIRQMGAYFAYLEHPAGDVPSEWVARRLARHFGLLALPGSFFGPGQDRFLRVAFANVEARALDEFAKRLPRDTADLS